MSEFDRLSRREMLGLAGAATAAVVTGGAVTWRLARSGDRVQIPAHAMESPDTTTTTSSELDRPEDTTTTSSPPPDLATEFRPYSPVADEVFAEAKMVGVRAIESLMLFGAAEQHLDPIERTLELTTPGAEASVLADATEALFVPGADSMARIVYPQLGGLHPHRDPTSGSVMVVVDQHLRRDGLDTVVSRCVDVRVALVDDEWLVQGIENNSGRPVPRPVELSDEALRVLEHPWIDMPDSIRWDIYDGIVDRRILQEMADLADQVPIAATTCMRGHPTNVFGTSGLSAHTVGRAVDIWAVGSDPIVQQRDDRDSITFQVAEALFEGRRIHRLGAPWAFDGPGGRSWTDPVHLDHIHLGVSA